MQSKAKTIKEYISGLPTERKPIVDKLRKIISKNIPAGFHEEMSYGMIGRVIPHSIYPAGYHCNTALPLPFLALASQKNNIVLYHMGLYADEKLLSRFKNEYPKYSEKKLNMGKSCIRFTDIKNIPYDLIAILVQKITTKQRISLYEKSVKK